MNEVDLMDNNGIKSWDKMGYTLTNHMSHGQYSQKTVDGHPIHNKDPKITVIINPYEPLDD